MESRPSNHVGEPPLVAPAWQSAMVDFLYTRTELIRLESRDATAYFTSKACSAAIAAIAAALAWVFVLIGSIGAIAHFTKIPWWAYTLVLGIIHVIIAWIAAKKIRASPRPLFPVTRGEFEKDKQWLQTLKSPNSK